MDKQCNDYQPQPGDKVLVTFPATCAPDGYYVEDRHVRHEVDPWGVLFPAQAVVRVEPAPAGLPTGWGARIRGTVTRGGRPVPSVRLALVPFSEADPEPWCIHPDDVERMPDDDRWVGSDEMSDVVVLDPGDPA